MLESHEKFYSAHGKRMVLIAEDERVNRDMLAHVLESAYEIIFAENGQQALDQMRLNKDVLSLVLLDLFMPVMDGREVLRIAKEDDELKEIPVIVITSDELAEAECLNAGSTDFIKKPYPPASIILARVKRTIELSEDRQIISSTERDTLTGLYNREFFYRFAEQYDQHHRGVEMDAIVVDVNHFHMVNERFGTAYGDSVLRCIGEALREEVSDTGGIVCRREADTFLVYCPHGKDYTTMLDDATAKLMASVEDDVRIWLRMGVYAHVDKGLDIERRFDRAKMAADTVQGSYSTLIGFYDSKLHERERYLERLIEGFNTALIERQFHIHYQPKFDIRPEIPMLVSAEALVRWQHPELGFISPGEFIALFEDNGMIQSLDEYVWRAAAAQVKDWKERFGFSVPVSVNVSRIDMYDPNLVDKLLHMLDDNGLTPADIFLEITESAYTQDSEQIISTVNTLRNLGFKVEMDDFGTGYSSLNMISTLPIDVLKMDMQFVRNAFSDDGDAKMLEIVIDIADYLSIPVIAEGVETQEQVAALRKLGCDYVQGYYFSRPLPAEEYEKFVIEYRRQLQQGAAQPANNKRMASRKDVPLIELTHALSSGFEFIYYIDIDSNHYVEFSLQGKRDDLQMADSGDDFFVDVLPQLVAHAAEQDKERLQMCMDKQALLSQLSGASPVFVNYQVATLDGLRTRSVKAVKVDTNGHNHIVMGFRYTDAREDGLQLSETPNELNFSSLAQALSGDMESVYYVDMNSDTYMEFKTGGPYKNLELQVSGSDFFGECARNIEQVVFVEDREKVLAALEKQSLLEVLREQPALSIIYRLIISGEVLYYNLKAVWADSSRRHVIIGVTNVDDHVKEESLFNVHVPDSATYMSIVRALAVDYFSIYYVNIDDDRFVEYSANEHYQGLNIETSGDDFFNQSRRNIRRVMHPDDVDMFMEEFTKERVLAGLRRDKTFTLTYRLMIEGKETYVHLKATSMGANDSNHIVIGVSNVDEQMRREQEHGRVLRLANQDALTGVKSKHAYTAEEHKIDQAIDDEVQPPFAVVVCDINGLKIVNDTLGHAAGDQYIKDACHVICTVFKHSPVFRVGGDEFVAILRGGDLEIKDKLMAELEHYSVSGNGLEGVSIAGGLALFDPAIDASLASVFKRADAAMYENKKKLKCA